MKCLTSNTVMANLDQLCVLRMTECKSKYSGLNMSLQAVVGVVMTVIAKWRYQKEPKTCRKVLFHCHQTSDYSSRQSRLIKNWPLTFSGYMLVHSSKTDLPILGLSEIFWLSQTEAVWVCMGNPGFVSKL